MTATDRTSETPRTGRIARLNTPVFVGSSLAILAVTIWILVDTARAEIVLWDLVAWTGDWFGWFYVLLATAILVFVIVIATSRYGRIRLGPEHSTPQFSTFAWASMLFAAGIGTDLMFFAVAEPVEQFMEPPSGVGETVDAAREATVWTLFHYGISGWAMYALMGMSLGYFAYRMNLPLAVRSALYPLFGKKINGPIGHTVDLAAILGTIFGVATTLGIAVVQLNFGLTMLFDMPMSLGIQIGLIGFGVLMATASAVSGVERGIKWLSQLNVILAVVLALWILVAGRTTYLLNALVLNIGDFFRRFPDMTMQTFAFEDTGTWMTDWTLFFWAWWIAWASFVGLFLARISRGRTIRQFVLGTLIIPFTYIVMWISIFGNASIDVIRQGNRAFGQDTIAAPESGFYTLLSEYPGFAFVAGLAIFVALLFYVTSADSGALVMANLTSRTRNVHADGHPSLRIFWSVATGALTLALLSVDGIVTLQAATVVMGVPFAIVMVLVMVGLSRALRVESYLQDSRAGVMHGVLSGRSAQTGRASGAVWRNRLTRMMTFPTLERAEEYLEHTVLPALTEVAAELGSQGAAAQVSSESDEQGRPGVVLRASVGADRPFQYRITRTEAPIPAFSGWAPRGYETYARLEVHLRLGGQGYDVMGYTHSQLIDDVLDQYEGHLEFLRLHEGGGASARE